MADDEQAYEAFACFVNSIVPANFIPPTIIPIIFVLGIKLLAVVVNVGSANDQNDDVGDQAEEEGPVVKLIGVDEIRVFVQKLDRSCLECGLVMQIWNFKIFGIQNAV